MMIIKGTMPRALITVPLLALLLAAGTAPQETAVEWPRVIEVPYGRIVIYQPQPESFDGDRIEARFAMSVTPTEAEEPVFGVAWVNARVSTDRDQRTARVVDIDVTRVRFPESTEEQEEALGGLLEEQVPLWELDLSIDQLLASLEGLEESRAAAEDLDGTPPTILFSTEPTVLVSIDGDAILQPVGDTGLMRLVNTPFTIILSSGTYYLLAGEDRWYAADALDGAWAVAGNVPTPVAALAPPPPDDSVGDAAEDSVDVSASPPAIVVVTEPTELIVTRGDPEYTPLSGTDLLYVSNSDSDVLLDVQTQQHYVVLSGRWFTAASLDGEWTHVRPADLPAAMATIPPESDMGHLLLSVPGTLEAEEAVIDHQIPQTSAIRRSEATFDAEYDGDPQFEGIEDTRMAYATNTSAQVIRIDGEYYAVSDGVWFVSGDAEGPWRVADSVPDDVHDMPADVPVYNVKYVYVFDSTPEVVYVGYYPGYTYSFVYGGTVVYGTGYYYRPWYGSVYYPHHATWGFHVRYNPWYGWGYGFSYSTGRFTFAIGWGGYHPHYGGWWGPVGYRGYRAGYHRGWHAGYRAGARAGYRAGYRAGTRADNARNNIYDRDRNRGRNATRPATADRARPQVQPGRSNNIYSDRNGDVYRRGQDGGWESRNDRSWEPGQGSGAAGSRPQTQPGRPQTGRPPSTTRPQTRPQPSQPQTRPQPGRTPQTRDLNRSAQGRDRGAARARSAPRPSTRGGGRRR
jgi:hypothetical protein